MNKHQAFKARLQERAQEETTTDIPPVQDPVEKVAEEHKSNPSLPVSDLMIGEVYECVLTFQRVLVIDQARAGDTVRAKGRAFNHKTGEYYDFIIGDKQLRRF